MNSNELFLEAYKELDKLCKEIYPDECSGITSYINYMKNTVSEKKNFITGWDADLKQLIRLRHIRNQLSHDIGTLNSDLCSKEDANWLKQFKVRILNSSDPLSMLKKAEKNHTKRTMSSWTESSSKKSDRQKTNFFGFSKYISILLLLLVLFIFLLNLLTSVLNF